MDRHRAMPELLADWNEIDLTQIIRAHGKITGKITLHLQALTRHKGSDRAPAIGFASSEHEDAALRPVLRIESPPNNRD